MISSISLCMLLGITSFPLSRTPSHRDTSLRKFQYGQQGSGMSSLLSGQPVCTVVISCCNLWPD